MSVAKYRNTCQILETSGTRATNIKSLFFQNTRPTNFVFEIPKLILHPLYHGVVMPSSSATANTTKSQKTRGLGFTSKELDCLLDCIDEHLPIGPDEWDRVHRDHLLHFPNMGRTKESLKKKFTSMYQKRTPTGDPNCPSEIRRAKQLYEEIKKKSDLSDCEDGRLTSGDEDKEEEQEEEEASNNDNDDDDEENQDRRMDNDDDAPPPAKRSRRQKNKATADDETVFRSRTIKEKGNHQQSLDRIVQSRRHKKKSSANDEDDFTFKKMMKFAMFQSREDAKIRREEARAMQQSNQEFMKMMMMTLVAATGASAGARAPPPFWGVETADKKSDDSDEEDSSYTRTNCDHDEKTDDDTMSSDGYSDDLDTSLSSACILNPCRRPLAKKKGGDWIEDSERKTPDNEETSTDDDDEEEAV